MVLGLELGSTRIKSILIDEQTKVLTVGVYDWENIFEHGLWTYSLDDIIHGIQESYSNLDLNYYNKYGKHIESITSIGISAMMHGYMALDKHNNLLVPFRTWRNTNTENAANKLSNYLKCNIPLRWSVAHYYECVLEREEHVNKVDYLTTLAGYVHFRLTGEKVLGIGDASGMFPIKDLDYDVDKMQIFNDLLKKEGIDKDFRSILPTILVAGQEAGVLTSEGAKLLDKKGFLKPGAKFCAPEGDAGTGMVATNCVKQATGNISVGTSAFAMFVLDKPLIRNYKQIDVVSTPMGLPVAMIHVNNCTTEINCWINLFFEVLQLNDVNISKGELIEKLFKNSLLSDEDNGLFVCGFHSGEPMVNVNKGVPMLARKVNSKFNLSNLMQANIFSALAPLSYGMKILKKENVDVLSVCAHGGFLKTDFVGQNAISAVLNVPITVLKNSGEGGAFGMSLLALYLLNNDKTLEEFLEKIFENQEKTTIMTDEKTINKYKNFMRLYDCGLQIESSAGDIL